MVMLEESKNLNLHPNLHPLLLEFHRIEGYRLRSVRHVYVDLCLGEIALEFDQDCLIVKAEPSDDTIIFQTVSKGEYESDCSVDVSHSETWRRFIGESFGWGWVTINQQDAVDGILLSFGGVTPGVLLNVMASTIKESIIKQLS
jgi:hypothetical protein